MIIIKVYGVLRLKTGIKEIVLDPKEADSLTVQGTFARIIKEAKVFAPELDLCQKDLKNCIVMRNQEQVKKMSSPIKDGDVLAFLSPAGGG